MHDRPNIFLIMTDQQKASATSIYGNTDLKTPCWDRIAAEGVTFEHAYTQSAICTPSRTSMMTGTYPPVHRVFCHQNHAPENLVQLPEFLQDAGYQTVGAGHYESTRNLTRGWTHQIELLGTEPLMRALRSQYEIGSREVGWSAGEFPLPPEEAHASVLNDEVFKCMDQLDPDAGPVFLHVAYMEPHPPYFCPQGFLDRIDWRNLELPKIGDLDQSPAWQRLCQSDLGFEKATEEDRRRCLGAYYAMIEYVDGQIDRLLRYLDARGMTDNSWIILTSDHGDFTGEKGLFNKCESTYGCLLHVPLVIRGPNGRWRPGDRVGELVETMDLFPTICSAAEINNPEQSQGHDLISWLKANQPAPLRSACFSAAGEYHGYLKTTMPSGLPESGRHPGLVRGARDHRYTYIRDPDYGDEAYDLREDPHELCNLLQNGGPAPDGVESLQRQMNHWETQCRDHRERLGVIEGKRNFDEPLPSLVGRAEDQ